MKKKSLITKRPPKKKVGVEQKGFNSEKYVRLSDNDSTDRFKEIGKRVFRKELKWIKHSDGFHYYLILKKTK